MKLFEKVLNLIYSKTADAVDRHQGPDEKIREAVRSVEEHSDDVVESLAAVVADFHLAEAACTQKQEQLKAAEANAERAVKAGNNDAAQIFGSQVLTLRRELVISQANLKTKSQMAQQAKNKYQIWQEKTEQLRQTAATAGLQSKATNGKEQMNRALQVIDESNPMSELNQALQTIKERDARAAAVTELNEDPSAAALRQFEEENHHNDVDNYLESLRKTAAPATVAS